MQRDGKLMTFECKNENCRMRFRVVPMWPLACRCGWEYDHPEDMGTPPIKQNRGMGDIVASVLHRMGVRKKPGCGCERRQKWLNSFRRAR